MKKIMLFLGDIFRFHKFKIFIVFASFLIFSLLLFPFNDLGTLVTTQVAQQTNNNVFLKFEGLSLSLFPVGIELSQVEVQTPAMPSIKADELTLAPSIVGLLTFNPGITASAKGLLKGDVNLSTRGEKKKVEGKEPILLQNISLNASKIDVASILGMFSSLTGIKGKINFDIDGKIDPLFADQPDIELSLDGEKLQLENFSFETMMGPMPLPDLLLQSLKLKGLLKGGKLEISESEIGEESDDLYAKLKGNLKINIDSMGGQIVPNIGAYTLNVHIKTKKALLDRAGLFFAFIENMKLPTSPANAPEYMFRVDATDIRMPPNITPLKSFN